MAMRKIMRLKDYPTPQPPPQSIGEGERRNGVLRFIDEGHSLIGIEPVLVEPKIAVKV